VVLVAGISFPFWKEVSQVLGQCMGSTIDEADKVLRTLIEPAKATGTNRIYTRQIAKFARFYASLDLQFECSFHSITAAYVVFLCQSGTSKSEVEASKAALKWFYGLFSGDALVADSPLLGALASATRRSAPPVKHHLRASREELAVIHAFCFRSGASLRDIRTGAFFLFQFGFFLRASEAVSVLRSNLSIDENAMYLTIPHSKRDQEKRGARIPVARTGTPLCPVCNLEHWLSLAPSSTFLFPSLTQPATHMSKDSARNELARVKEAAGIARHLVPHSMRGGAATAAMAAGVPQSAVKTAMRLKSDSAFAHYVEITVDTLQGAASIL
jgi:integrase